MNSSDAYRMELENAMLECEANGDIEGAEHYQSMLDEYDENCEEE